MPVPAAEPLASAPTAAAAAGASGAAAACVSCGHAGDTPFCPACGERRPADRRYTLREFAEESWGAITDVDSRMMRSIRTLFNQPGELTVRYMRGERGGWLPPLRLFLLMNVLFFVAAGFFNTRIFDTPLRVQTLYQWYSDEIQPLVAAKVGDPLLGEASLRASAYAIEFDARTEALARSLVILMVPMWAVIAALLNVRKRRPLLQHVAFALHAYAAAFGLLVAVYAGVLTVVLSTIAVTGQKFDVGDAGLSAIMMGGLAAYFAAAQRRAYDDGWPVAIAKGVVLGAGYGVVLQFYRPILFFLTYWWMGAGG